MERSCDEQGPPVEMDEYGVTRYLSDGTKEYVAWDDLAEVEIVTTADGPFIEDVFFILKGRSGSGCVVPHGLACDVKLLERLQRLPGFRNEMVIKAMCCTDEDRFSCWNAADQIH